MARPAKTRPAKQSEDYRHDEAQRLNIPEAGLARYETGKPPTVAFAHDAHTPPELS
jgi:hypothetical protein